MEIKYIVGNYENSCGRIVAIREKEFDSVEDAIEYHKKQRDGSFSWWEIRVLYT